MGAGEGLALGANGAALGLLAAWAMRDILGRRKGFEDESDPNSGHGWHCRLLDASALRAAGFSRVRKATLLP